ncbi:hypothetical protein ACFWXI_06780 [[Kitasatospora] papulosa]|uniref:hypothetical protein n=1 Tax=[Kitasatospora] papulosa TaxID=1464011 RepID=UPI00369FBDFE
MSARDELAAQVAEHGPFPMPTGDTAPAVMKPEQRKAITVQIGDVQPATDALIGTFAESVASVRNHEHPSWEDLYCMNLTSYMGERMAPVLKRLLNTETENAQLRVRIDEVESRPRRFSPLDEAVQGIETAIAPLTGDQRAGADMVLAYLRTLTTPVPAVRVSPWDRAVAGLNALVDANIAFWIEPDGHISGPFGNEHIEWDQAASRWRLVHDNEDEVHPRHPAPCRVPDSPDCTCPVPAARDLRPGAEAARRMIADRQAAEDPHDSPLHRTYETSHDLPTGGAL